MPVSYNSNAGNLTIGGVAMFCPAWRVDNITELWLPAEQRGTDKVRPGVAGRKAIKRRDDATRRSLRMLVVGDVDRTGAATSSLLAGLYTNIAYLRDNVVNPTNATDGTRSAVLTVPGGTNITEPVHVTGMEISDLRQDGGWARLVIDLSIPSGRFQ